MVAPRARNKINTLGDRKVGITPSAKTWLAPYNVLTKKSATCAETVLFKRKKLIKLGIFKPILG